MKDNENEKENDNKKPSSEEVIDRFSKISENVIMISNLLNKYDSEEAKKKYLKIKNKV